MINTITIFRVRDGVQDHERIVKNRGSLRPFRVDTAGAFIGVVYVRPQQTATPPWLAYLREHADLSELELFTASSAAVLVVVVNRCTYALIFGNGRFLVNEEYVERRFGLRVLLNCVAPDKLRSLDHVRLDGIPRHTREQLSKVSGVRSFGLDVERDVLRGLTGRPVDPSLGQQLTGSDQLTIAGPPPLHELLQLLTRYESLSRGDGYKASFPWVDNLSRVTSSSTIGYLEQALTRELQEGSLTDVWMAVPEIVDWTEVNSFRYQARTVAESFDDIALHDYFSSRRPRRQVTIDAMRRDSVYIVHGGTGEVSRSWSAYRCLLAELVLPQGTFVLSDGEWFAVSQDFMNRVTESVSRLAATSLSLPLYGDRTETDYNRRVAGGSNGYLHLLDRDLIQCATEGPIEPCDLFSRDRHIVHVKRYGGSSVLSHLFAQGVASGQMMAGDRMYRVHFNEKLPEAMRWERPEGSIDASRFEVAFVIVDERVGGGRLPFLSKVNLRNATRILQQLGFRVTLTLVRAYRRSTQ